MVIVARESHTLGELREVRVSKKGACGSRDNQPDHVGPLGCQRSGCRVWMITIVLNDLFHPLAGCSTHVGAVIDHP